MINIFSKNNHKSSKKHLYLLDYNAQWMNRDYYHFAKEAYIKNVVANRCINLLADSASAVKYKLFSCRNNSKTEIMNHPILDLIYKPNTLDSTQVFFKKVYISKILSGNAYIRCIKDQYDQPIALEELRPDKMTVLVSKDNVNILGYKYQVTNKKHINMMFKHNQCDVLHIKNYHPMNDFYGLSQVESAANSIEQHNQASNWNQALLQNGAKPSGALMLKGNKEALTEEQFDRLKQQFEQNYCDSSNAGKPLLLEGGLEWKEMSLSPKDMDFIAAKNNSAREIALAFGIPPQLLGIPGDNKYSNYVEAKLSFWEETIIPLVEEMLCHLSTWLNKHFKTYNLRIEIDQTKINALSGNQDKLWNKITKADFLSNDEKRNLLGFGIKEEQKHD